MKIRRTHLLAILLLTVGLIAGCQESGILHYYHPLPPPGGVYTITGDGRVDIGWNEIYSPQLDRYYVYRGGCEEGPYYYLGSSRDNYFVDYEVVNGVTYYYAVAATDRDGRESELSYEYIHDTPRPEGWDLCVEDYDDYAGVDFSRYNGNMIVPYDHPYCDMYILWDEEYDQFAMKSTTVLDGGELWGNDIQPFGWVGSLDEVDWAPEHGWTLETEDVVLLVEGHAYQVWTWDNHFAKFRVTKIGYDYVLLDWAYQVDWGNAELSIITTSEAGGTSPRVIPAGSARALAGSDRASIRPTRASH